MAPIFVTGGAGFIGSHLAEELIERGHHVVVLDNLDGGNLDNLRQIDRHQRFHFVKADICESSQIAPFIEGADFVFHLAAQASQRRSTAAMGPITSALHCSPQVSCACGATTATAR